MCTVTLSYDYDDALARQALAELLSSGLFEEVRQDGEEEFPGLDYNDPYLWEVDDDMLSLPEGKETFTPEEALELILTDIRKVYKEDDAI